MNKHAYLIIVHKNKEQVSLLLQLLDDERNDIFIHCDPAFHVEKSDLICSVKHSKVYFVPAVHIEWGRYSLIQAELNLLQEAVKGDYQYYHLLSGQDLPLKTQEEIHHFFDSHDGLNYVRCVSGEEATIEKRVKFYTVFKQDGSRISRGFFKIQGLIGIDRRNKKMTYGKGANWFSINNELAHYVIEQKKWIRKQFKLSWCGDEIFLQTLVLSSKFKNTIVWNEDGSMSASLRKTVWEGKKQMHPHIYTISDYDLLIHADELFARKFDWDVDREVMIKIAQYLKPGMENDVNHLLI